MGSEDRESGLLHEQKGLTAPPHTQADWAQTVFPRSHLTAGSGPESRGCGKDPRRNSPAAVAWECGNRQVDVERRRKLATGKGPHQIPTRQPLGLGLPASRTIGKRFLLLKPPRLPGFVVAA